MLVTQATKVPPGWPVNVPISVRAPLQAGFGPMIWPEMWPLMFVPSLKGQSVYSRRDSIRK
jgi:hypothetical protein